MSETCALSSAKDSASEAGREDSTRASSSEESELRDSRENQPDDAKRGKIQPEKEKIQTLHMFLVSHLRVELQTSWPFFIPK